MERKHEQDDQALERRDFRAACRNTAAKFANNTEVARQQWVEMCRDYADLTEPQAMLVLEKYRRAKLVKLSLLESRYRIIHGSFLDRGVLRNAADVEPFAPLPQAPKESTNE